MLFFFGQPKFGLALFFVFFILQNTETGTTRRMIQVWYTGVFLVFNILRTVVYQKNQKFGKKNNIMRGGDVRALRARAADAAARELDERSSFGYDGN